jgi:hypothetical protein
LLSRSSQTFCLPACLLMTGMMMGSVVSMTLSLLGYLVSNCSHIFEECFISCRCSWLVQNCDESHFLGTSWKTFPLWVSSIFPFSFFSLWVQFLGTNFMKHFVIF